MIHFGGTGVGWWDKISGKRIPIPLCPKKKNEKTFYLWKIHFIYFNLQPSSIFHFYFAIHYIKIILYFNVHKQVVSCKKKHTQCFIGYVNNHDTLACCTWKKKKKNCFAKWIARCMVFVCVSFNSVIFSSSSFLEYLNSVIYFAFFEVLSNSMRMLLQLVYTYKYFHNYWYDL